MTAEQKILDDKLWNLRWWGGFFCGSGVGIIIGLFLGLDYF